MTPDAAGASSLRWVGIERSDLDASGVRARKCSRASRDRHNGVLHATPNCAEEDGFFGASQADTRHAGSAAALWPHGVRRELQQLRIGRDEHKVMFLLCDVTAHYLVAWFKRDELPAVAICHRLHYDSLDGAVARAESEGGLVVE